MGARVYDPYTGTFTQPDPIQGGGATPYGYTDGDPVNETDLGGESVVGRPMCGWNGQNYEASRCGGPTLSDVAQVLTWATLPLALVDPAGDAADVADATVIVRGGTSDVPSAGEAFSGARGSTVEEAAAGVPHGTIRSTTAGDIRASGGSVRSTPEYNARVGAVNDQHVDITLGSKNPFSEPFDNPVPRANRFGGAR